MAYGVEVVLGWPEREFAAVSALLGVKLPVTEDDWQDVRDHGCDDWMRLQDGFEVLDKSIKSAQIKMLAEEGYQYLGWEDDSLHLVYDTPWGRRDFQAMRLALYYDWREMGERPQDAVVGVSLSSRYRPMFLDAQDPHGTIYHFILDEPMQGRIALARRRLTQHVPAFDTSRLMVVQQHY
jgi:hypothetical protein